MKRIVSLLLLSCTLLTVMAQNEAKQVQVYQPKTDSYDMVNVIDLLGDWQNTSSVSPTAIHSTTPKSYVMLGSGNQVRVNDIWVQDYPTKLRNCTWHIVDANLILYSPDLGKVELEIVRVGKSSYYEFVLNQVTYRKLVNRSDKKLDSI